MPRGGVGGESTREYLQNTKYRGKSGSTRNGEKPCKSTRARKSRRKLRGKTIRRNPVARNSEKFNKPKTIRDRKKDFYRPDSKREFEEAIEDLSFDEDNRKDAIIIQYQDDLARSQEDGWPYED